MGRAETDDKLVRPSPTKARGMSDAFFSVQRLSRLISDLRWHAETAKRFGKERHWGVFRRAANALMILKNENERLRQEMRKR